MTLPRHVDVVRAFIRLRALVTSHHQLAAKLGELEKKTASHDKSIVTLFGVVRSLMAVPEKPKPIRKPTHAANRRCAPVHFRRSDALRQWDARQG